MALVFRRTGFTVIELLITVLLIAVLMAVAAPSLRDLIKNARMTGLANTLMTDLAVTRSEAVKRGARTAICPSDRATQCTAPPYTNCQCTNTAWNLGYLILQDTDGDGEIDAATDFVKYVPAIDGVNEPQPNTINVAGAGAPPAGGAAPYVSFLASGVTTQGGAGTVTFSLCDSRSLAYGVSEPEARGRGRKVTLSGTGRALSARCTCNASDPPVCP